VSIVWRAQDDETETVAELLLAFRNHLGESWPTDNSFVDSVERLIGRSDTEFWLAASEQNSPPVAVCQLRFRYIVWTVSEDCWLEDLFVREDARRRGLGAALVRRALDRARERGCGRIELDTNEANGAALGLYEAHGFSAHSKGGSGRDLFMGRSLGQ
jgi:GNAT superfamily N-acetyltransferase